MRLRNSVRSKGTRMRLVPWIFVLAAASSVPARAEQVEMYFHVDREAAKEIDSDEKATAVAEKATLVVLKRLQAADIRDVQVAQMKWQIRVSLDADVETIDRVKRLVSTVGQLELLVEATEQKQAADSVPGTRVVLGRAQIPELEPPWIRVKEEPRLDSSHLANATAETAEDGPAISLKFTEAGKTALTTMTQLGVERRLAIVVDGVYAFLPVIRQAITAGEARITFSGPESKESELKDLAAILGSGPLPAPLRLEREK